MSLSWDALTTVDRLRSYLEREKTTVTSGRFGDDYLEQVINGVSAAIATYCGRQLIAPAAALTYTLTGDATSVLRLPEYPIVSITSIKNLASVQTIAARTVYGGIGYAYSDSDALAGLVRLQGYTTDTEPGAVEVKAILGYSETFASPVAPSLPTVQTRAHRVALDQLDTACLQWASLWFNAPTPSVGTVAYDQLSFAVTEQAIPTRVRELLVPYRRLSL